MEADRTGDRDEREAAYGTAQGAGAVSDRAFGVRCGDDFGIFGALSGDDGVGFLYQDTILTPAQEGDTTVYSGKLRGEAARFTVHADKSV